MKYFLSTFGIDNPFIECDLPDHAIYPVGTEIGQSIDLEYTSLLLGEKFVIDQNAINYINENLSRLPFLKMMLESINKLQREGMLETIDTRSLIQSHRDEIIRKTELLSNDLDSWLNAVRLQWDVLQDDREEFVKKFGTTEKTDINSVHFTVANAVKKLDGSLDKQLIAQISKIISSKRNNFTLKEKQYLIETTKPLIAHTIIQDLIRYKTGCLILDWDDSAPFYSNLYKARWDEGEREGRLLFAAKNLFEVFLPHLKPNNIDAVIRFIRDNKNVTSLRNDIIASLENGNMVNNEWISRYLTQILKENLSQQKLMRKVRFGGSLFGILIPGSSLVTEALVETGISGTESLIDGMSSPSHRWLYALLGDA